MEIYYSNIHGNTTENDGCIYNNGWSRLTIINSGIYNNKAELGGGIFNDAISLTIVNSGIHGDDANYGGGIFNEHKISLENSSIFRNNVEKDGDGIYNDGSLTVKDSSISYNKADMNMSDSYIGHGGGIFYTTNNYAPDLVGKNKIFSNRMGNIYPPMT